MEPSKISLSNNINNRPKTLSLGATNSVKVSSNVAFGRVLYDNHHGSDLNVKLWGDFMKFTVNNPYEPALTEEKLDEILNEQVRQIDFNPVSEYEKLADGDKKALKHLVIAANILNDAFIKQEHPQGLEIRKSLIERASLGDKKAEKTLKMFKIFNGIQDERKETLYLIKDQKLVDGKNVFQQGVTPEEVADYLKKHIEETPQILSNNTVVKKENGKFIGVPYQTEFKKEFSKAAEELLKAAETSTNKDFNEYLKLQAKALTSLDEEDGCNADIAWTKLAETPLEFTIARESYSDEFTGKILRAKELAQMIKDKGIEAFPKDFLGIRVGIVDIKATNELQDYKNHLKKMGEMMPLKEQYKQSIDTAKPEDLVKQTLVDVNMVTTTGEEAAGRPGLTLAQNLPNPDKLSVKRGHGSRNVFHKEIRMSYDPEKRKKLLEALLDESCRPLYSDNADHLFTIGHELSHSLGPIKTLNGADKKSSLGDYGDAIEEAKADLGSLVTTDYFVNVGKYIPELQKEIFVTWSMDLLPLEQPSMAQAHRVREIMQFNYFKKNGAIKFEKDGKLSIDANEFVPTAKKMLTEIIQLQLDGDEKKAEEFFKKWFIWGEDLEYASKIKKELKPKIYMNVNKTLAEKIIQD